MSEPLNTTSLLHLYLADELSPAQRAEVDRLLAKDPRAAAQLQDLQQMTQAFAAEMSAADGDLAQNESVAVRRIGQAMRQRITDRLIAEQKRPAEKASHVRYPWWMYPAVGAAVVLIALISWWGNRPDQPMVYPSTNQHNNVAVTPPSGDDATQLAVEIQKNFAATNITQSQTSVASLDAAEDQIAELAKSQSELSSSGDGE